MRRAVVVALLLAGCGESAPLPNLERPLALLDRPLVGGGGEHLDVAALQGRVVVVNFWSPG